MRSGFHKCGPGAQKMLRLKLKTKRNQKLMKTTNRIPALILGATFALGISLTGATAAQKGDGALLLIGKPSKAVAATAVAPAASTTHRCGLCGDVFVTVVDKATKGPNHTVKKVAQHTCPACETKIVTTGVGKAKRDVAIHSCGTVEAAAVCCATN